MSNKSKTATETKPETKRVTVPETKPQFVTLTHVHADRVPDDPKRMRELTLLNTALTEGNVKSDKRVDWTRADLKRVSMLMGSKPHNPETYTVVADICKRAGVTGNIAKGSTVIFPSRNRECKTGDFQYLLNRVLSQILAEIKGTLTRSENCLHIYTIE